MTDEFAAKILPAGRYAARAVSCAAATNKDGTKECFAIEFRVEQGEHAGHPLFYRGWLTERTLDRTLDSLRFCGWTSDDVTDAMRPEVIGAKQVDLTVEVEEYDGKLKNVVAWVNDPAASRLKGALDATASKLLAARLKGAAIASRQRVGGTAQVAKPQSSPHALTARGREVASFTATADMTAVHRANAEVDALLAKAAALKAAAAAGFSREPGDDDEGPDSVPY